MTKKHVLACENCGSRNYNVSILKNKQDYRLELKNFVNTARNIQSIDLNNIIINPSGG
ncbi:50S ribosomal protein L33 [Pallidibacillus pasinlerensis]|uniref:50S ribosomal protein L33 n=1 Tax=Pallidibacillus pasinlerensis TaxID=2703818 RepID=UPI003898DE2D